MTNVNVALEKYADAEKKGDISAMISLQGAIKFNGGGKKCAVVSDGFLRLANMVSIAELVG